MKNEKSRERLIEMINKMTIKANELQEEGNIVMKKMMEDPFNTDLFIEYIIASDGAINLLEKRNNFTKMLNQLENNFKEQ